MEDGKMKRVINFPTIFLLLIGLLLASGGAVAQAACSVKVVNQTGFDMAPLKLVQEKGESKKVVGQAHLYSGKSYTFKMSKGGKYRAYGLLTKDGEKKYAKGNLYSFQDGSVYSLTLQKVVFSEKGNSISFISKEEFDNLI